MTPHNIAGLLNEVSKNILTKDVRLWRWWKFSFARIETTDGSVDRALSISLPRRRTLHISLKRWGA